MILTDPFMPPRLPGKATVGFVTASAASSFSSFLSLSSLLLAIPLALPFSVFLSACAKPETGRGQRAGAMGPAPVQVAKSELQTVPLELDTFGTVEPVSTIEVKAQVSGELIMVLFHEGDAVQTGQELFHIDPRPFEVALSQAAANLARAQAQLGEAKSNLAQNQIQAGNAQTEFERNKTLLDKGMVTQEEYDQSRTAAEALRAAVSADEAAVRSGEEGIHASEAAIDAAELSLDYCTIRSPIDGRTGSLMIHQGNLVRANDTTPMVVITQMKPIYVSFTLPEKHLPEIRRRSAETPLDVSVLLPDEEDQPILGKLTFIDNRVDAQTRTILLKATYPNEDERLWPGQYLNEVRVRLGALENAVVVPTEAVQTGQQGTYVYVIDVESKAEFRAVRPGADFGKLTVIEEGLQPGETVVTEGHLRIAPDAAVKVMSDREASSTTERTEQMEQRELPPTSPVESAPTAPSSSSTNPQSTAPSPRS